MTTMKKQKLAEQPNRPTEGIFEAADISNPPVSPITPRFPELRIADITDPAFEQFQTLSLDATQKHEIIGQIRSEIPLMDVHEIDTWLLGSLAKQLRMCIFPTAKVMQIEPGAVKRMLDTEFQKAYGLEIAAKILDQNKRRDDQLRQTLSSMDINAGPIQPEGQIERTERNPVQEVWADTVVHNGKYTPDKPKRHSPKLHSSEKTHIDTNDGPTCGFDPTDVTFEHYRDRTPASLTGLEQNMKIDRTSSQPRGKNISQGLISVEGPTEKPPSGPRKVKRWRVTIRGKRQSFHDISESRKEALTYQGHQRMRGRDAYIVTLESKAAALRWQALELGSPVQNVIGDVDKKESREEVALKEDAAGILIGMRDGTSARKLCACCQSTICFKFE